MSQVPIWFERKFEFFVSHGTASESVRASARHFGRLEEVLRGVLTQP